MGFELFLLLVSFTCFARNGEREIPGPVIPDEITLSFTRGGTTSPICAARKGILDLYQLVMTGYRVEIFVHAG